MAEETFRRKLTAILSADVAGYSRLMAEDETATVKTLESYREVMSTLIMQHRGRVIDSPGDNVLAEFTSVVDAVQCAVAVQKEFQARNAELPENRRMEFRIGINLGDVIEEGDRIYGDGVNIAARLEALSDPGGICVSKTAFDQIESKLPLGYEYLGEQEVKNIPKPVGAYRVLMEPRVTVAELKEKEKALPVWRRKSIVAGGVLLVLVVVAALIWNFYFRPPPIEVASVERMAFPLPDKPSIAVLPFVNMSGDPKQEYFSDGITEQIITGLSKIPLLFVVARNSTFVYKGKPVKVQQVAEELGVRYLLEGSIQRSGDRIRITAQLIDAIKGHHLWAEIYDRDLKDLFALQDDITMNIIRATGVKLLAGGEVDIGRFEKFSTRNIQALEKFMKGVELMRRMTKQDMSQARKLFEEAIALDAKYIGAHTLLAMTHLYDAWLGWSKNPRNSIAQAIELGQRSLSMGENFDMTHSLFGHIYLVKRQYEKAIAAGERAIELNSNSADAHARLAMTLTNAGRHQEAIALLERAIRLNPYPPNWYLANLGNAYRNAGKHEKAVTSYKKVLKRNPNFLFAHTGLASVYSLLGREDEARAEVEEILKTNPAFSLQSVAKILLYKNKADRDMVIDALRKAGLPATPPLPLPDKPSIAVLPFVNMSGDPEQEYFSDGITEEIITALSKTPKLFVIARNSTFTYKGKPVKVQRVGRELGVKYVLEGSVRKAEDRVRVTAQLVDTKTGSHLWAERYDRELKDIFAIQDEITMRIMTSLEVKLTEGGPFRIRAKGTDNLEAYLLCLQASEEKNRLNKDSNLLARQLAEKAIALDPKYPEPYYILASSSWLEVPLGLTKDPRKSIAEAMAFAQRALALDNSFAPAHSILGMLYTLMRQHDKGISESEKAISLEPNSAGAYYVLGEVLRYAGRHDEAIAMCKKALRLDPFPPSWYYFGLANAYTLTGQHEEAITAGKKAIQIDPNNLVSHVFLAAAYSLHGLEDEAFAEAKEVLRISPEFSVDHWDKTIPYRKEEDRKLIIGALRKAGLK